MHRTCRRFREPGAYSINSSYYPNSYAWSVVAAVPSSMPTSPANTRFDPRRQSRRPDDIHVDNKRTISRILLIHDMTRVGMLLEAYRCCVNGREMPMSLAPARG